MKHFYCDFRVQHPNLHKNWHISFLLATKSEILYISVFSLVFEFLSATEIVQFRPLYNTHLLSELKIKIKLISAYSFYTKFHLN